jgi:hypothetical protein
MLTELESMQSSDESVWSVELSFDVESRSQDGDEIVHKVYTFSWAEEWGEWMFTEYVEKRSPDTTMMHDRNWRKARHIMWHDVDETPSIDVPPEISSKLAEATGADSINLRM